jgi:hypothetical protein
LLYINRAVIHVSISSVVYFCRFHRGSVTRLAPRASHSSFAYIWHFYRRFFLWLKTKPFRGASVSVLRWNTKRTKPTVSNQLYEARQLAVFVPLY